MHVRACNHEHGIDASMEDENQTPSSSINNVCMVCCKLTKKGGDIDMAMAMDRHLIAGHNNEKIIRALNLKRNTLISEHQLQDANPTD